MGTADPKQKMVLEFRIYPTGNIKDGTPYSASVLSFDRQDLATDMTNATEMGIVCVINTVRHVRAHGFSTKKGNDTDIILPG